MKQSIYALVLLLALVSCTSIDKDFNGLRGADGSRIHRFYATMEQRDSETKVYADKNMKVLWNAGDYITVFNKATYNSQFMFTGNEGANAGNFDEVMQGSSHSGNSLDNIYAVYPYSSENKINNAGNTITLTLPAEQQYKEHSFGIGANTMVAVTDNTFLPFKNLGGYLQLRLYGDTVSVSSIIIQGNSGEKIAGKANVTVGLGQMPTITMDDTAISTITLVCDPPVLLGMTAEEYTDFWFVIPPTTFSSGFTVTVIDDQGGIFEKTTTNSLTVARSTVEWMSELEVTPGIANVNPAYHVADAVDLGLSVRWASWNVGAIKPNDVGGRYAWGEIETKTNYSWDNYKWSSGTSTLLTKYCTSPISGTVDGKVILDAEDDAAQVYWGNGWRMPTRTELTELVNKCTWSNETLDGVSGYRVTGPNGNSIFFPFNGQFYETDLSWNMSVSLWSSVTSGDVNAYLLMSTSGSCDTELDLRHIGLGIRPVCENNTNTVTTDFVLFEDANFKAYCVGRYDTDGDGEISMEEAEYITAITINSKDVASLKGIEHFKNLDTLECSLIWNSYSMDSDGIRHFYYDKNEEVFSKLTSIDVSHNTKLKYLDCNSNQLNTLDVSNNKELKSLRCDFNQLTTLDVSNNTALRQLYCESNKLTALNVSNNTALTSLECNDNQLTTLDVSNNTSLHNLYCSGNRLTALDVSHNISLTALQCDDNQLTALDVSLNIPLRNLYCQKNQLTALDVSNNTALRQFYCHSNQLTSLDVSNNTALTELRCNDNQLDTLDVSNNTALTRLYCDYNQLTTLDVSNNTALKYLNCSYNQLISLDISNNTLLTDLQCRNNQLTTLDVSNNTKLTRLLCNNNPNLTEIWLKTGQTIKNFTYDTDIATIRYKD